MHTQVLISFFAYLGILLSIGGISYKKQRSSADFIVGSRSLNFWLTALTAHASDMSSWLFMAFPAAILIGGLPQGWIALGLLGGMFLNWQFVAKKLRILTENYNSYTLSTFFEKRFDDNSGFIRVATAIMAIFFLTCYIAAGLIAMGGFFESVFGINYSFGITIATITFMLYTFFGGFVTVAWTDLFQGLFLLCVIIAVPVIALGHIDGGIWSIVNIAQANDISLRLIPDLSWQSLTSIIFIVLSWGLGYFGQPHIVTKFMGINNAQELTKSKYVGMSWMIVALSAAACVGLVGMAFFKEGLSNPELVFVEMVKKLFNPLTGGFILCGVLAASISTMASQILVCASILSEDLYKHLIHKHASQRELLKISKIGVVIVALISLLLALKKNSTILEAVMYAWSGLGSAFGPLVLMSLYSKTANKYGAIAGIIVGGSIAAIWGNANGYITDLPVPSMLPGFFLGLLTIYVVSNATKRFQ